MVETSGRRRLRGYALPAVSVGILALLTLCLAWRNLSAAPVTSDYQKWEAIGKGAAEESLVLLKKAGHAARKGDLIALTNAGHAEINGASTEGALDGLAHATGVSRGRNTLVEVHAATWDRPWFAVYDKGSGFCAYLEVNPVTAAAMTTVPKRLPADFFGVCAVERIDAKHLESHVDEFKAKLDKKFFGGNEFRIVTMANAIAEGAPVSVVRAFEFHDHYCPGVTSGILMAGYLKKHFAPGAGGHYFVYAVDPWCKEDALLVLLNATPGKRGYAATYPADADKARRVPEAKDVCNLVFRQNPETKQWDGLALAFQWAETGCPKTGNGLLDRLCADLWYLKRMDRPEDFVKVVKTLELPEGVNPKDWARPGVDPLEQLGLLQPVQSSEPAAAGS
jgi:formylmethanofuran dehydrogenase subunit E-like metal-binding protein